MIPRDYHHETVKTPETVTTNLLRHKGIISMKLSWHQGQSPRTCWDTRDRHYRIVMIPGTVAMHDIVMRPGTVALKLAGHQGQSYKNVITPGTIIAIQSVHQPLQLQGLVAMSYIDCPQIWINRKKAASRCKPLQAKLLSLLLSNQKEILKRGMTWTE